MFKRTLLYTLVTFLAIIPSSQGRCYPSFAKNATIEAKQIVEAIKHNVPIILDSCVIEGTLRLEGKAGQPDTIRSVILIGKSIFRDSVVLTGSVFLAPVNLQSCVFEDHLYFGEVHFVDIVNFRYSVFEGKVQFSHMVCDNLAMFIETEYRDEVFVWNSRFKDIIRFWNASFSGPVCFWDDTLEAYTDFGASFFNSTANFYRSKFAQTSFVSTDFNEDVVLTDVTFTDEVDFSLAKFENCYVRWYQLKDFIQADYHFMSRLIENFKKLRLFKDADQCYLFLKDNERRKKPWFLRYWEYWFLQIPCGYGVRPENVLTFSIFIIMFFTFLYMKKNAIWQAQETLGSSRRRRMIQRLRRNPRKRIYDAFYFSFQTFIIGVVPDWHPTDNYLVKIGRVKLLKFRTLAMIEGALGWILLVLFVVTLTRKFIR